MNLNYIYTTNNIKAGSDTQNVGGGTTIVSTKYQDYDIHALNYGINLDLLFNFLALEEVNVGLFAGVGIGANTFITNNSIDTAKTRFANANNQIAALGNDFDEIKDKTYTGFDAWVNVGIHTNFLQNHDIEVLTKIPFVGTTAYNKTIGNNAVNANVKLYMPWNVNLRYIYSF